MIFSSTDYVGSVILFTGEFAPRGWLYCDGQALVIANYPDLYSVIGDTYGGGASSTTFNLPSLNTGRRDPIQPLWIICTNGEIPINYPTPSYPPKAYDIE